MSGRKVPDVRRLMIAGLVLGLAGAALPARAADGSGSGDADRVSQAELEQFVAAFTEFRAVQAEYRRRIKRAEDDDERARLKRQGRQALAQAIRDEGLEIGRYKYIGRSLQEDEDLRSRFRRVVRERAPAPPSTAGLAQPDQQ